METKEIAKKLVAYCKKADWAGAHDSLYAPDATSTEPYSTPEFEKETRGLDAIRKKGKNLIAWLRKLTGLKRRSHWLPVIA